MFPLCRKVIVGATEASACNGVFIFIFSGVVEYEKLFQVIRAIEGLEVHGHLTL